MRTPARALFLSQVWPAVTAGLQQRRGQRRIFYFELLFSIVASQRDLVFRNLHPVSRYN